MKKIAIVTGSDKKYFPFLKNLVFSLKKTKSLEIADLCILDVEDINGLIEIAYNLTTLSKATLKETEVAEDEVK